MLILIVAQMCNIIYGRFSSAVPHSKIDSMLDLGCGSAVWTAAVALKFPETHVVGIDITPPTGDFGLDNLTFVTTNIEDFGLQ